MKKILLSLLTLCMSFCLVSPISAQENDMDYYMTDVEYLELDEEGLLKMFTFYSEADDMTYLVKTFDDRVEMYDATTGEKLGSASIVKEEFVETDLELLDEEISTMRATPDDYEDWGSYTFYKSDNLHFGDDIFSWSFSQLAGYVLGAFGDVATAILEEVYNNKYEGLDAKIYNSINRHCSILIKERYDFYEEGTNNYIGREYMDPRWRGNPQDYSYPAACRVLAQRY